MTFSIIGYCELESKLGVAVATAMPNVGNSVPHVEPGIVAIATQANCNRFFGIKGINLIKIGIRPNDVIKSLIKNDPDYNTRQIIMIDSKNRKAAFTGNKTKDWSGHKIGNNFIVAGNLITCEKVLVNMFEIFIQYEGCLEEKLFNWLSENNNVVEKAPESSQAKNKSNSAPKKSKSEKPSTKKTKT